MSKRQITRLQKIILGAVLFLFAVLFDILTRLPIYITVIPYIFSYIILATDIIIEAFENVKMLKFFNEFFIITAASLGAFLIGKFSEAVIVALLFQIGELFKSYAVSKARKNIKDSVDMRPKYANIKKDGQIISVDPGEVNVGDTIIVKPGETVPLDGIVLVGHTYLDISSVCGEQLPKEAIIGDKILSGSVNTFSEISVEVTKTFKNSTASKILDLISVSEKNITVRENFINNFSKWYTPTVIILAFLLALIPSLINGNSVEYIHRALVFLVVAYPCSLIISVPLCFFAGIGKAGNKGVLIKGSAYLEAFAHADTIVFDKNGTITEGNFKVSKIVPCANIPAYKLLEIAATAESFSNHPIAVSLLNEYDGNIDKSIISEVTEISGCGVIVKINGKKVAVGNHKLMKMLSLRVIDDIGTVVHVAVENEYMGHIVISDEIKPEAKHTIKKLKELNIKSVYMFTGDNKEIASFVANEVGIHDFYCELLPQQKVEKIKSIKQSGKKVCFIGDGINDAPALAVSDIGIVMGGIKNDSFIETADIVLMTEDLTKLYDALKVSKFTLKKVKQNILFILTVKFLCLLLGAIGVIGLWFAVFADVATLIITVLNAIKISK